MDKSTQLIISSIIFVGGLIVTALMFTGGGTLGFGGGNSAALINSKPGLKEFNIVMQNNNYNPSEITVNLGDKVVINFTNRDSVGHAVGIPHFNATVPGGHIFPGQAARMEFVANKKGRSDAATCGGANPTDKTDDHGEELIVNVI